MLESLEYDMVPMEVQFSSVADSIDRFDDGASASEETVAPTIRKDFPESWIWETLDG